MEFLCADCGTDMHADIEDDPHPNKNYYMVTNKVWRKYGDEPGLCMNCLEERMGRPLKANDLRDCVLNHMNTYTKEIINNSKLLTEAKEK